MTGEPGSRWLLGRKGRADAPMRLYCFPHSGGPTAEYMAWADQLPGVEVLAVQLPGRGSRFGEALVPSVPELVELILDEVSFRGPFSFFGHSFGAMLAFEVARGLAERGLPGPRRVHLSACSAPGVPPLTPVPLHKIRGDAAFVAEMERVYGAMPREIHEAPQLLSLVLPVLRADMEAAESYRVLPGPKLRAALSVTGGRSDKVDEERLRPWAQHTAAAFGLTMFDGGHFYFRASPRQWFAHLARALADDLGPAKESHLVATTRIPVQSGRLFEVKRGETLRVIDPFGQQVSDVFAFNADDIGEALSSGRTLDNTSKYLLTTGDLLYSNRGRPMMRLGENTAGRHDFLLTPCSQQTFDLLYPEHTGYHPSCLENLGKAFAPHGVTPDQIGTTFNAFMNVIPMPDGTIQIQPGLSKPGEYLDFIAEMNLLVGVTSCSAEMCNNNHLTPIDVQHFGPGHADV